MTDSIEKALVSCCRLFMVPIARFLLRYGFSYRQFEEIAKWAFVTVATEDYGIRGRKTNVARVAVMTGLSRKEVGNIRGSADGESFWSIDKHFSLPSQILSLWHQSIAYLDETGAPRKLPLDGAAPSFTELARECSMDVPATTVLGELVRSGSVAELPDGTLQVVTRRFTPVRSDAAMIYRFGQRLRDVATTIDRNLHAEPGPIRRFEATADSMEILPECLPRLRRLTVEHGSKFLELVDEWLSASSIGSDATDHSTCMRVGVGVYFFQEDR